MLNQLRELHPAIGDVRGSGLFIGVELINRDGTPASGLAADAKNFLRDNFILVSTDGPYDNVIKSKPPLCFNTDNALRVIEKLDSFLAEA